MPGPISRQRNFTWGEFGCATAFLKPVAARPGSKALRVRRRLPVFGGVFKTSAVVVADAVNKVCSKSHRSSENGQRRGTAAAAGRPYCQLLDPGSTRSGARSTRCSTARRAMTSTARTYHGPMAKAHANTSGKTGRPFQKPAETTQTVDNWKRRLQNASPLTAVDTAWKIFAKPVPAASYSSNDDGRWFTTCA